MTTATRGAPRPALTAAWRQELASFIYLSHREVGMEPQHIFREESGDRASDRRAPVATLDIVLLEAEPLHQVAHDDANLGRAQPWTDCSLEKSFHYGVDQARGPGQ